MKLFLKTDTHCHYSEYSPEPYGAWSEELSFEVEGVFTEKCSDFWEGEFYELHGASAGDSVYVLYLTYSTGDSFGYRSGNGEIVGVYKDIKVAKQAHKIYMENEDEYSIKLPFETYEGVKFQEISNPAAGYFESLESLEITGFTIENVKGENK